MALHGSIQVNGAPIGGWSAQRTFDDLGGHHGYTWVAMLNGITWSGHLRHHYADGAAVLSAKVLSEYARKVAEGDES